MRIAITGAGGQVGLELASLCRAAGDDVVALGRADLDITNRDQVHQTVGTTLPDVVVNCAAWTAVDDCESDEGRAMRTNGLAVRWMAEACASTGTHLVQLSTDYVFDGTKSDPYHEWDVPAPRSVYGASKLAGEHEASRFEHAAVVRTSWVMGAHGSNMLKTVLSLRDRDDLAFVDDQRGSPTFTADLAVAIRHLAASRLTGCFHLTNEGDVSWYEFARDVLTSVGASADRVRPISTAELDPPRPAVRPANSVLANLAWAGAEMPPLPRYRDALRRALTELGF